MIIRDLNMCDEHTVMVRITNNCNVNCQYCYINSNPDDKSIMTQSVIDATISYIDKLCHKFTTNLIISGGEIGLLDQNIIKQFINKIRLLDQPTKFNQYQTSLLYKITKEHIETFELFDIVCVSYNEHRLLTKNRRDLFFKNLQVLKDNNIPISLLFLLDKETISKVTPKRMFDIATNYNVSMLDFWMLHNNQYVEPYYDQLRAKNKDVNSWMFKAYLERENHPEYKKIMCTTLVAMEQALVGNNFYCHSRNCNETQFTISVDGTLSCCDFRYDTKFGTVFNPDINKRQYWISQEKQMIPERCKGCQYFKYCKGGCYNLSYDGTDCGVPHQIFEYLINKHGI